MSQVRETWLLAGGLLPVAVEPPPDSARVPVELVRPRSYRHPALGRRVVIRVVGDSAAVADDRAIAFLGFEPPAVGEPLALGPRRQVGFPQWVLVNDPERAGEALAVAEEMEPAAVLARTKPGHAKDLYERLARRLPAAHQPSFWEQAGRVFLAAGRRRHAASAFERARAAERIHALPVDEATRREVFLEFALAGALPAKSLAGYQAELRQGRSPAEAYQGFRELVLRRAVGGLPPWTELPGCARRFARAAGLDPDTEEERLLAELLVLPATRRAPAGFWRHSRPTLLRMAAASAALRGRLLNLFPAPSREGGWNPPPSFEVWWLGLLDEAGALNGVTQPAATLPPEALPALGAASWLGHYLAAARQGWWAPPHPLVAALLRLIPRMADRLKAEGRPLVLAPRSGPYPGRLDANLLDLCLEHGVPVADPPPAAVIDLAAWLRSDAGGGVRRDLEFVAADRRFGPLLDAAVPAFCANARRPAEELLVSPALQPLVQGWLERTVKGQPQHHGEAATAGRAQRWFDRAATGHDSLVALAGSLEALAPAVGPHTFRRFPDAQAALGSIDVAVPLAATLRGGLLDELGWPALDEAVEELGAGGQRHWSASWPVLVVWNPSRAIAVGPGGRVAEHDLRLTYPHGGIPRVLYADGQFLVVPPNPDGPAYWSGAPTETFTIEHARPWGWFSHTAGGFAALLSPDGGLVSAGGVLYPGDRTLPQDGQHLVSDGDTCRTVEWAQGVPHALRELDPPTGEPGRFSLPSFFEDRAAPGETLLLLCCSLAPLPDGLAGTPLGHHGRLVGFRVATAGPGQATRIEGVDGRSLTVPLHISDPVGLVTWPGAQEPRLLSSRPWGPLALWDPGMKGPLVEFSAGFTYGQNALAAGTGFTLPPAFWHHLTPRDEAGSLALRGVTDEAARELLHAALADLADHRQHQAERPPRTAAAVERLLPAVSHPRLVRGVLGALQTAALLSRRRDELVGRGAPIPSPAAPSAALAAAAAAPPAEPPLDVEALLSGLVGIDHGAYRDRYSPWHERAPRTTLPAARQLHLLGRFFAQAAGPDAVAHVQWETALPWRCLLSSIGALALRAVSPAVHAHEREALLALLELWAQSPFAADPGSFWIGRVAVLR